MVLYKRCYFIFLIGALGYCLLEILWRGYTHPTMGVVGGLCLIVIYFINKYFRSRSRSVRAALCAGTISLIELASGILINIVLHLNVWDYSDRAFNIMGQICPLYSLLWFFLSYAVIYGIEKLFSKQ